MTSKILILSSFVLATATAALAGAPAQNHHCKMADGTMDMAKTKRECKAAKGTWAKDVVVDAKTEAKAEAKEGKTEAKDAKAADPKAK